jgi:hypothetical protein
MEIDFKKLSPEQEKIFREILGVCHYFQHAARWGLGYLTTCLRSRLGKSHG